AALLAGAEGSSFERRLGVLARLPWIVMLGPAGAGTASLVRNSSIEFKPRERAATAPEAVRHLDLWASERGAVLTVVDPRLADAQALRSEDWSACVRLLCRARPRP